MINPPINGEREKVRITRKDGYLVVLNYAPHYKKLFSSHII